MGHKDIYLLGYASGIGARSTGSSEGPRVLQQSPYMAALAKEGVQIAWQAMLKPEQPSHDKLITISMLTQKLALLVESLIQQKKFFGVLGGDHTCGIGTWSGAQSAMRTEGPLGLIWVDAHMDSHTPHTSPTGNIHGMPMACLLGSGASRLTTIIHGAPKLHPENVCLVGVRSYESEEAQFLQERNVRIFFMDEIKRHGLDFIMQEALKIATKNTAGFGISIDIDSIDPKDAPGTGATEPDGIPAADLRNALQILSAHPKLIGLEIAEFDPQHDKNQQTEKLIPELLSAIMLGK